MPPPARVFLGRLQMVSFQRAFTGLFALHKPTKRHPPLCNMVQRTTPKMDPGRFGRASKAIRLELSPVQNSQTYANRKNTATKNTSQIRQPMPVFSAIRSMRLIVPFSRTLVFSKVWFICSAKALESLISSPMAMLSCLSWETLEERMDV